MSISVLWLDHEQAKLTHFSDDRMEREVLRPPDFLAMIDALKPVRRLLILGPDSEKNMFLDRLRREYPTLAMKVVGCEASEHPSDQQIAGHVSRYFARLA